MLMRRKSSTDDEYHHCDLLGTASIISSGGTQVIGNNIFDIYGVVHYSALLPETPYRFLAACGSCKLQVLEEGGQSLSLIGDTLLISARSLLANKKKDDLPGCKLYDAHRKDGGAAVDCQDCCDDKLVELLKERFKDKGKELAKCLAKCLGQTSHGVGDCAKDCLRDAGKMVFPLPSEISNYTTCCYLGCDTSPGIFNPPGPCNLKIGGPSDPSEIRRRIVL